MAGKPFRVIIVGAGTGGLCLAQGLRSRNVDVDVFERDATKTERLQGYRLSIDQTGRRSLEACLPQSRLERLVAQSARPSEGVTFLDHRLNRLLAIDFHPGHPRASNGSDRDMPVGRAALRRMLLEGLDDVVHFGKTFERFEERPDGTVAAHFADGSVATGDVLVGADGASSRVRRQLLPDAQRVDTGIVAVSGKRAMNDSVRATTPAAILRGPTLILGPHGRFLFAGAVEYDHNHGNVEDETAPADRDEYVMWGFSTRREAFALPRDRETPEAGASKDAVVALMSGWHPGLLRLVRQSDDSTLTSFRVQTSVPIDPWPTRRVTLLGDALHNMTPFRGIGANTALRDAAALHRALVAVSGGASDLLPALAAYERAMIDYGFRAVRASLREMHRVHSTNPLARGFTKTVFRVVDRIPPLQGPFLSA
jgi:2-polyprenyl-6-methoxyphenol hydroxylase-like FAD-dependent oxidoreductase